MKKIICEDDNVIKVADELSKNPGIEDVSFAYTAGGKKYRVSKTKDALQIQAESAVTIKIPTSFSHEKILSVCTFLRRLSDLHPPSNKINQDDMQHKVLGAMHTLSDIFKDVASEDDKNGIYGSELLAAVKNIINDDFDAAKKNLIQCCENLSTVSLAKITKEGISVKDIGKKRFSEIIAIEEACKKIKNKGKKLSKDSISKMLESCESITEYDVANIFEELDVLVESDFIKENRDKFLGDR